MMQKWMHGSYRTYEEWKLKEIEYTLEVEDWFLPYLWGMETLTWIHFKWTKSSSSYRTYEEWKLSLQDSKPKQTIHVLTVPMRNGNFSSAFSSKTALSVLTVPMRNGNTVTTWVSCVHKRVLTVPMRNGNKNSTRKTNHAQNVLTVPMRNGNCFSVPFR